MHITANSNYLIDTKRMLHWMKTILEYMTYMSEYIYLSISIYNDDGLRVSTYYIVIWCVFSYTLWTFKVVQSLKHCNVQAI